MSHAYFYPRFQFRNNAFIDVARKTPHLNIKRDDQVVSRPSAYTKPSSIYDVFCPYIFLAFINMKWKSGKIDACNFVFTTKHSLNAFVLAYKPERKNCVHIGVRIHTVVDSVLTWYSGYSLRFPGYGLREVTTYFDMITISFLKSSFLPSLDGYTQ